MTSVPGALILGANLRALGIVRSLGRRGIETWILDEPGDQSVTRTSRYVSRTLKAPCGSAGEQRDGLLEMAVRHRLQHWTLFPTGDESAAALAREHRELATCFRLSSPAWEVYRHAYHKRLTDELAGRIGVEHPWTRYPRTRAEVETLDCEFPAILKPDAKARDNRFTQAKAWRVEDRASLVRAWEEAASLVGADAVMVQELIPGSGEAQFSFAALCDGGIPVASLVARRTRQYPRDFGHSSSMVETVLEPEVEERGRAIVAALGWTGLIEVEFKYDARDGSYKLLDINGRVWTWHVLGQRAGVDFPYLAWRLAQGLSISPVRAQTGVRWVRFATDIPSALGAVLAGELSLRGWAASLATPRIGPLLARDDVRPAMADPAILAWRHMRRRFALNDARPAPTQKREATATTA